MHNNFITTSFQILLSKLSQRYDDCSIYSTIIRCNRIDISDTSDEDEETIKGICEAKFGGELML